MSATIPPPTTKGRTLLTEGGVTRRLLGLAGPMLVGLLAIVGFNAIDTLFVARLGTLELAAMSFTFPVAMAVHSVALGLGIGATATISAAIGAQNRKRARRLTTDALILAFLVVLVVSLVGIMTVGPLFRLLGANDTLLPFIEQYMTIWYLGMPFVIIPMVGNSAIRAAGDTRTPMAIMLVATLVNLVLDPLLIFGLGPFPAWGLTGAALATVLAHAVTLVASLWVMIGREQMIDFKRVPLGEVRRSFSQILHVGIPATMTQIINPLAMGVITRMLAGFGVAAIAGFGVATRIEMVVVMVVGALASVIVPFVGQNWGAHRPERVRQAIGFSYKVALVWGAMTFLLALPLARPIADLFGGNAAVTKVAAFYLQIVLASTGLLGISMITSSAFNGLNRPIPALALSAIRLLVLYVPLAWIGGKHYGLAGIFGAAALANMITGVTAWLWLRKALKALPHPKAEKVTGAIAPNAATV